MNKRWLIFASMILFVLFLGCDGPATTTLENNYWTLVSFEDAQGNVTEVPEEMPSTLYFDKTDRTVTGTVRCNQLRTTYWATKRRIFLGNIAVTEMGCGPDPEGQDQFVVNVLSHLVNYSIQGDALILRSDSGKKLTYKLIPNETTENQILSIEIGSSFGMCMGYCNQTMTIDPETITLAKTGRPEAEYPLVTKKMATPEKRWNDLIALLDMEVFNALPEVIGCPDCADGGAETIAITTEKGTQRVTIEYGSQIKGLESFLKQLRSLKEEMFTAFDANQAQASLDRNREIWTANGIANYQYTFRRSCECLPEEDIVVTVQNGEVAAAVYTPSGEAVSMERMADLDTVEDLFDLIQAAIERPADRVQVQYDPNYGHPANIYIDYDFQVADEEVSYKISKFQLL